MVSQEDKKQDMRRSGPTEACGDAVDGGILKQEPLMAAA